MKKILYIITTPDWGGAQFYVYNLARRYGHVVQVTVATGQASGFSKINLLEKINEYKESPIEERRMDTSVKTHQFQNLIRQINLIRDIGAFFEIKNFIEKERPDTVHLNSSKAGILGSFAKIFSKHKPEIIYTVHGWVFLEPMNIIKKWFYIFLEKLASRWRDKIIVLGEKEKQIALKYKICPETKLEIKPHDYSIFNLCPKDKVREKLSLPQDKKIIGTIANLYPAKGLNYLIEAAARINNPDILFCIIGEGPLRKKLEEKIEQLSLQKKIVLTGEKFYAAQYLYAFDIFVLPSIKEGAPYVILEAMAASLPIVAADVGNVAEMLKDYQNKIIVPPANVEALINAIIKFITPPNLPLLKGRN